MSRPQVSVISVQGAKTSSQVPVPTVFSAPVRADIVHSVFTRVAKNKRQAYAVSAKAGHQTSAESWGTGRAVARIPRVGGSGTHRAGQGAFGNMCRGGRMFAPTKTWRRWHVKVNQNEKRYATASAIAASGVTSLVLARGHKVDKVEELPLVVSNEIESLSKTKEAVALLKAVGAHKDVVRVLKSRKLRAGKGKMRGRRFVQRKGPLVVYAKNDGVVDAFRNIPGVETVAVTNLSVLHLAPGSHLGRFVIWSQAAFESLDSIFTKERLPANVVANVDVDAIIKSSEIQSVVRAPKEQQKTGVLRRNPLKHKQVMLRLNPYYKTVESMGSIRADTKNQKAPHKDWVATLQS